MGLIPKDNIFCPTTGTYEIKKKKTCRPKLFVAPLKQNSLTAELEGNRDRLTTATKVNLFFSLLNNFPQ